MTQPTPAVPAPAKLGPVSLRNRIVKAATYEGRISILIVLTDAAGFSRSPIQTVDGMVVTATCYSGVRVPATEVQTPENQPGDISVLAAAGTGVPASGLLLGADR